MRLSAICLSLAMSSLLAQNPGTPGDQRGWVNRGVEAFKNARYGEAAMDFQKAVDLNPSDPTPRLYLATTYMQQYIPGAESADNTAMAQKAAAEFRAVLGSDSNNRAAMSSLASLALNQKKFDDAQDWYRRLINLDPGNAEAYYSLAFIAWSKWYPAYQGGRRQAGMKPEAPGPIADLAVRTDLRSQYWQMLDDGIWNLNKALDLNPQYGDAMAYMNLLVRERADLRDTREEYDRDIKEADRWFRKTIDTRRMKAAAAPQGGTLSGLHAAPPPPPPPLPSGGGGYGVRETPPQGIIVDATVQQRNLVSQSPPVYPPLARQSGVQGVVKLSLQIAKDGSVQKIEVMGGHPLLIPAAVDAVKQWRYHPTLLNGSPVEVSTTVDVSFDLLR